MLGIEYFTRPVCCAKAGRCDGPGWYSLGVAVSVSDRSRPYEYADSDLQCGKVEG